MDLHERWPHRWRNPKTESFQSPMHGLGVRAKNEIEKDETIIVYGGIVVPKEEIKKYWDICGHIGIQISDNFFMVPPSREELTIQGVINHSCEPNVGFRNQVELVALRNIKSGEEITFDYAFCETTIEPFECKCGTARCRKRITSDDWKIKELQDRYWKYFSPYLRERLS